MSQRRIVVLHVIEGLGTGGSEQQLAAFLLRSDRTRFRHEVCTLAQVGRFAEDLARAGIPVHALGARADGDLFRVLAGLWGVVRRVRPHLIHSTLFRPTIGSRAVGRVCRTPVVTTLVNTTYEPEWRLDNPRLSPFKAWAVQTIDRWTARWWGGDYIAITESVKSSAVRRLGLPRDRITVIRRGLAAAGEAAVAEPGRDALRAGYGWAAAYPVVLNIARLVPQKGQRYAIRAMHRVISQFPSARLVIAGEGPSRSVLERLIHHERLDGHVTLLGERRDTSALLRAADVFVFPSLFEGLGNALLEAMAAGKPCVVSNIPTLREVTADGTVALLADIRSPEELAANVLRLAHDRAGAAKLGDAARQWVRTHYNLANSVVALEAVFERVAAFPSPREAKTRSPISAAGGLAVAGMRALDARRGGVLRALVYHRVCDRDGAFRGDPHVHSATPEAFDAQMEYLTRHYTPISADQAVAALCGEAALPPRAVLVTFDDGYRDFLTCAWPILKRHRVPALLFIPTAFPGTDRAFWWDELYEMVATTGAPRIQAFGLGPYPLHTAGERWAAVRALNRFLKHRPPDDLAARLRELRETLGVPQVRGPMVLTWEELRGLVAEGLAVGAHTRTHPALPGLPLERLADEVRGAHADLQQELGQATPLFSYPYGLADGRVVPILKDLGYAGAFISLVGHNRMGRMAPFLLHRHSIDANHSLTRFSMNLTTLYAEVHESGRGLKARLRGRAVPEGAS